MVDNSTDFYENYDSPSLLKLKTLTEKLPEVPTHPIWTELTKLPARILELNDAETIKLFPINYCIVAVFNGTVDILDENETVLETLHANQSVNVFSDCIIRPLRKSKVVIIEG